MFPYKPAMAFSFSAVAVVALHREAGRDPLKQFFPRVMVLMAGKLKTVDGIDPLSVLPLRSTAVKFLCRSGLKISCMLPLKLLLHPTITLRLARFASDVGKVPVNSLFWIKKYCRFTSSPYVEGTVDVNALNESPKYDNFLRNAKEGRGPLMALWLMFRAARE